MNVRRAQLRLVGEIVFGIMAIVVFGASLAIMVYVEANPGTVIRNPLPLESMFGHGVVLGFFLISFVIFIIGGALVTLSAIRSLRSKSYLVPKYRPTWEDFM